MELKDNPFLQQEDYAAGYRESIEKLKNHPEMLSFEKLCYALFHDTELGKKWMEEVERRYLIPSLVARESPQYQQLLIWSDGFKDFARMVKQCVMSHDQRIKAEIK